MLLSGDLYFLCEYGKEMVIIRSNVDSLVTQFLGELGHLTRLFWTKIQGIFCLTSLTHPGFFILMYYIQAIED